jgi:hypothetical protein
MQRGALFFCNLVSQGNSRLYIRRLFVDYRHFDAQNITPRYEFGFGLSYTTFEYSHLSIDPVDNGQDSASDVELENNWLAGNPGPQVVGASTALWLHRPMFNVTFNVLNSGDIEGTEVRGLLFACLRNSTNACHKNRYHSCTCISLTGRASHRRSYAGSPTWMCGLARCNGSASRSPDTTCRYGMSSVSRGSVPLEHTLFQSERAVAISGWRAIYPLTHRVVNIR